MLKWVNTKLQADQIQYPKTFSFQNDQLIAVGRSEICKVKIVNKSIDSVHLLIKLSEDGQDFCVMDNMSDKGTIKIDPSSQSK